VLSAYDTRMDDGEDRSTGTVVEWNNDRGYGFIMLDDGRRAYVHNSAYQGNHLAKGQLVSAVVTEDARNPGKYAARQVSVENGYREPAHSSASSLSLSRAEEPDSERLEGKVSEWNERGFGFIELADGRRAYVHNSQTGGEHLYQGEVVSAVLVSDSKNPGKLAAHEIQRGAVGEDGVVTEWHEQGGYGFLLLHDTRRVYVHRMAIGGTGSLTIGQRLRVRVTEDARNPGKWCVAEVRADYGLHVASRPSTPRKVQPPRGPPGEDGTVTDWNDHGGYGFLLLDDQRRVYIHRSGFVGGAGNLTIGQRLKVTVAPDSRNPGKLSVSSVTDDYGAGLVDVSTPSASSSASKASEWWSSAGSRKSGPPGEDGLVTQWHEQGGYGFLTLADDRRVYIHRSCIGGTGFLTTGQRLRVTVAPDSRNPGKFSVAQVLDDYGAGCLDAPTNDASNGSDWRGSRISGRDGRVPARKPQAPSREEFDGSVAEWREDGGFGFVQLDDDRRVYVHRSNFGGTPGNGSLHVGQRLRLTVRQDTRNPGKWCTDEVVGEIVEPGAESGDQAVDGTVTDWKEEGGFGFLACDDGRRVYVHRASFLDGTGSLVIGQRVQITTKPDSRNPGKWCVDQLIAANEPKDGSTLPPMKRPRVG